MISNLNQFSVLSEWWCRKSVGNRYGVFSAVFLNIYDIMDPSQDRTDFADSLCVTRGSI